jgi:hypothetical protein
MEIQLTSDKYIIATSENAEIVHFSFVTSGAKYATIQPIVEQFDTIEEAEAYVDGIKGEGYCRETFKYLFEVPTNIES